MSIFSSVKLKKVKRSKFDLSHEVKLSTDMGRLTPILCEETLPGDTWNFKSDVFIRMAPLLAPIMQRTNVYVHHFFVPYRLLWNDWSRFITGPKNKDDSEEPIVPILRIDITEGMTEINEKSKQLYDDFFKYLSPGGLLDYLGFPTFSYEELVDYAKKGSDHRYYEIDMRPVFAYYLIWKEYYRDQNLTDTENCPMPVDFDILESGIREFVPGLYFYSLDSHLAPGYQYFKLLKTMNRCWEKDYFTSALPWPQKGPDVELPLVGDIDIVPNQSNIQNSNRVLLKGYNPVGFSVTGDSVVVNNAKNPSQGALSVQHNGINYDAYIDPNGTLKGDMSSVSSTTINELRRATALQRWLERNALGGNRYVEFLLNHFGVRSSDARIQRPQYLGGGKNPIVISEVLQTSASEPRGPLGDMAGHGVSLGDTNNVNFYCEEHGLIISIMSVMPRSSYQQGMPRKFQKFDRFDYAFPEFAHLGEQSVKSSELFYVPGNSNEWLINSSVEFGYQSRYAEYKYIPSRVAGDMKASLNYWHLGRIFSEPPKLNNHFVQVKPEEVSRIYAVENVLGEPIDHLWCQIYHNIKCKRKLPYYGTPL